MTEEDLYVDTPIEPKIAIPKTSLISMELPTPRNKSDAYKKLSLVKALSTGKFPVFLVDSKEKQKQFAMKVFMSNVPSAKQCFDNEIRFASLCHPNVIKTIHFEQQRMVKVKTDITAASIILTEYAPYGNFLNFVLSNYCNFTEKLIRTYFRQLIEGLEYLHNLEIAHLDIKLENLLLGEDFNLKIADFDLSAYGRDQEIFAKGTEFYRAPEMINGTCKNRQAADIYSAGIILFVFNSGGVVPHTENRLYKGIDLVGLLDQKSPEFWRVHCQIQNKQASDFSIEFRELIHGMMRPNPEERLTIHEIKNSRWYNGPIYTEERLKEKIKEFMKF